jgi:hypothetical protein
VFETPPAQLEAFLMNIHPQLRALSPRRLRAPAAPQDQFEFEETQKHLWAKHPWVRGIPVSELQEEYDRILRRAINGNVRFVTTKEKIK